MPLAHRAVSGGLRQGPRARRAIGPVAIEAGHAPFEAPAGADRARILDDRVMDGVLAPVRDFDNAAAEAARHRIGGPGPERGFPDLLEGDDPQVAAPERV